MKGAVVKMLLAFAPFLVFAVAHRFFGSEISLATGAAVALSVLLWDVIVKHAAKILDVGTTVLFSGLALYAFVAHPAWPVIAVRLCVDSGLLLIVLVSILAGKPFTLQYAREQVAPEFWNSPVFRRTNFVISWAWAAAFAVMVVTELALLYLPNLPQRAGMAVIIVALIAAVKFTGWYPEHLKNRS